MPIAAKGFVQRVDGGESEGWQSTSGMSRSRRGCTTVADRFGGLPENSTSCRPPSPSSAKGSVGRDGSRPPLQRPSRRRRRRSSLIAMPRRRSPCRAEPPPERETAAEVAAPTTVRRIGLDKSRYLLVPGTFRDVKPDRRHRRRSGSRMTVHQQEDCHIPSAGWPMADGKRSPCQKPSSDRLRAARHRASLPRGRAPRAAAS